MVSVRACRSSGSVLPRIGPLAAPSTGHSCGSWCRGGRGHWLTSTVPSGWAFSIRA
jgi:hypothetical protein